MHDRGGEKVEFIESTEDPNDFQASPELSSMAAYAYSGDIHVERRLKNSLRYMVETVSLNQLLSHYNAPSDMGYLSIDTEGSELAILQQLDFNKYKFRIITAEHNYNEEKRTALFNLLVGHGYRRVFEDVSKWDDWFVLGT